MEPPAFTDVLLARRTIAPHLRPTPLYHYHSPGKLLGAGGWLKHENHQPIGAFKVRGGVNLMAHLPPERMRSL